MFLKESIIKGGLFHLSENDDLDKILITPRVPSIFDDGVRSNLEEGKTPRFCMAPTLEGCLNGLGFLFKKLNKKPFIRFVVYSNRESLTNFYDYNYLTENRLVHDAYLTEEHWILQPLHLDKLGSFYFSKENIKGGKRIYPYNDHNEKKLNTYFFVFTDLPKF